MGSSRAAAGIGGSALTCDNVIQSDARRRVEVPRPIAAVSAAGVNSLACTSDNRMIDLRDPISRANRRDVDGCRIAV
jgi:hypothetical protein